MSDERATYLDSSALVKLALEEPESQALRSYLRRRRRLISSVLVRVEVPRALMPLGLTAMRRGEIVLSRLDFVRINDRVLARAGELMPVELRALDAIHLATASTFGRGLARVITYDERMASGAQALGLAVAAPS